MFHHGLSLSVLMLLAASGCGGSSAGDRDAADVARGTEPDARREPQKLADVPGTDRVTLHLYVSNQSFDVSPVGIDVWLEGTHVVEGAFEVEGQHNWILFDLAVPVGTRSLHAEGLGGTVSIDEVVAIPDERWGVLDFWYYPGDPTHPMFTWHLSAVPVAFQ